MPLAVNYSLAAAELFRTGQIQLDWWKCPAWPDAIAASLKIHSTYVHFPLQVGAGIGDAMDMETRQPADWGKVEALLAQTGTPFVNAHLAPTAKDHPDIPIDSTDPVHVEMLTERVIRDVRAMVERFGAERVIVENEHGVGNSHLRAGFVPQVVRRVVEETGCGFLFDLGHARLASHCLDADVRGYIRALPVERTREIHVSGIQFFDDRWTEVLRQAGIDASVIRQFAGRLSDHLPMTDEDWEFHAWAMDQVHKGSWAQPWIVTLEYGGISPLWEAITDPSVLAVQIPRLYKLVNGRK